MSDKGFVPREEEIELTLTFSYRLHYIYALSVNYVIGILLHVYHRYF